MSYKIYSYMVVLLYSIHEIELEIQTNVQHLFPLVILHRFKKRKRLIWDYHDEAAGHAVSGIDWDWRLGTSSKLLVTHSLSFKLPQYDSGHVVLFLSA